MSLRVVQVWDEYDTGFVDSQPLFGRHGLPVESITLVRTLWDTGTVPGASLNYHRCLPQALLRKGGRMFLARAYLERRFFRGGFLRFAEKKFQEFGAELVHFNFGFTVAQYPELARRRPFVVSFYGSDISAALKSAYWRRRYRDVLPAAKALLVLCEVAKQRLVDLGCDPARVVVWNLPAGVERYPLREQPEFSSRPMQFINTARFVEKKGHGLLLEALSLLEDKGLDFRVTLLGYSKGITWVREEIARRKLGEKVTVIDTQGCPDFAALHHSLLQKQDFFVMPSIMARSGDDEGGPALSMVVAQAAGLPAVCTRFPGSEITMRDGETGLYVPEADPASLAATLMRMVENAPKWRAMGLEGRRHVLANFGEREQVSRLVDIYRKALET